MSKSKPSVLIIGGLGYIGRFLALHIHQNQLASDVRLVDKKLPELAWLGPEFAEACSEDKFMQADATKSDTLGKVFDRADGKPWDYVFNCGGETKYSQVAEAYRIGCLDLALAVGKECANRKVKVFVELSTGLVYRASPEPSKETDDLEPRGKIATFKRQAEHELSKIKGLHLAIVRLPHVYGPYATRWMATALCIARVYRQLDEAMSWPESPRLRTNTVHVHDVSRALWGVATWYSAGKEGWIPKRMGETPIFNVVDQGNTNHGTLANIIGRIFKVRIRFRGQGNFGCSGTDWDDVVNDDNYELLSVWSELLAAARISVPGPLTPFVEREMLCETFLDLDGRRLEELLDFHYEKPVITKELVQEVIDSYSRMNWWP